MGWVPLGGVGTRVLLLGLATLPLPGTLLAHALPRRLSCQPGNPAPTRGPFPGCTWPELLLSQLGMLPVQPGRHCSILACVEYWYPNPLDLSLIEVYASWHVSSKQGY